MSYINIDGYVTRYAYSGANSPSKVRRSPLSQSINGSQIEVTGSGIGQTTIIHEAPLGTDGVDEVHLYAYNSAPSGVGDIRLCLYWGEDSSAGENKVNISYQAARFHIVDGKLLQNGLKIKAWTSTV